MYAQFTGQVHQPTVCSSAKFCVLGIQGKYQLSELKSLIVIWGIFGGVLRGLHLT